MWIETPMKADFATERGETRTGGRPASGGVIPGDYALSVGKPSRPAPTGWQWTLLTDVARLETGHTPSRRHDEYWGGAIPWVGIKDATENHGQTLLDTHQHTNELGIANSSARVLPADTVCLSRTASIGYVVVMGRPMATSQDFVNWVCSDRLDYRFLKYVLLGEKRAFNRFASGSTHQTIYFPEVKAFHVCLPSIKEQHAIALTLSALDDKIDLNRRMSETLEGMARAFFKSWFVDFDPVRAKAEGRSPCLGNPVAALFPGALERSDRGAIPMGWRWTPVSDLSNVFGGSTPRTEEEAYWRDGDIFWATPKDMAPLSSAVLLETERQITPRGLEQIGSGLLPRGTVLMSSRAPIGYLAIIEVPLAVNQGIVAMVPRPGVPSTYLLRWAEQAQEEIVSRANGSTFLEISKGNFRSIPILDPGAEALAEFGRIADPLHERTAILERESRTLAALRDTLLPRLISGELRIPDAERIVGEVA